MVLIEQFQQLGCRERRLRRASPPQDHDFANATARQRLQRMIGDVGLPELRRAEQQHTCHVQRDIAIADHHGTFAIEIKPVPSVIRMRSEEHTSELQSLMRISYADFCLKKKNKYKNT